MHVVKQSIQLDASRSRQNMWLDNDEQVTRLGSNATFDRYTGLLNIHRHYYLNVYLRFRQPAARTQKLQVLHIDFVMIHTEGILTLTCTKIRMLLAHCMIWNLEVGAQLAKGCRSRVCLFHIWGGRHTQTCNSSETVFLLQLCAELRVHLSTSTRFLLPVASMEQ